MLHPNRLKFLARIGRRSTHQALQRMPEARRYPILAAFLRQTLIDLTDEIVDLFDTYLGNTHTRAKRKRDEYRQSVARATETKVRLFHDLGRLVLNQAITDA